MPGRILPKEEARRIYEDSIVRTKRDPALLEYMGRGMFPGHERLPDPAGGRAEGHAPIHPAPQEEQRDVDRVRLSPEHPEIHPPSRSSGSTSRPGSRARSRSKSIYSPIYDAAVRRDGERGGQESTWTLRDAVPSSDFKLLVYTLAEGSLERDRPELPAQRRRRTAMASSSWPARRSKPSDEEASQPKTVVFVLDPTRARWPARRSSRPRRQLGSVLDNLREDDDVQRDRLRRGSRSRRVVQARASAV